MPATNVPEIPVSLLRKLVDYDPATGDMRWKSRTPDMFDGGVYSADRRCATWNKHHAGQPAFVLTGAPKGAAQSSQGTSGQPRPKQERIFGRGYVGSRVAWALAHGQWPDRDEEVEHIDGHKTNNRMENLQLRPRGTKANGNQIPRSPEHFYAKREAEAKAAAAAALEAGAKAKARAAPRKNPPMPMPSTEATQVLLYRLLDYYPATGHLFWRERTPDMYPPGTQNVQAECKRFNERFAGLQAFSSTNTQGYRQSRVMGQHLYAHRVIWMMQKGEWPQGTLRHKNGDRRDNRLRNLELVPGATPGAAVGTHKATSENHLTQDDLDCRIPPLHPTPGYPGVYSRHATNPAYSPDLWYAKVELESRYIYRGPYKTPSEAQDELRRIFGSKGTPRSL